MQGNLLQAVNTGLGRRTSQAPERVDFSKISTAVKIPNLIEIQRESYNRFLQMDFLPAARPRSISSNIKSAIGSASADVWKVSIIFAPTVKTAARQSRSTR